MLIHVCDRCRKEVSPLKGDATFQIFPEEHAKRVAVLNGSKESPEEFYQSHRDTHNVTLKSEYDFCSTCQKVILQKMFDRFTFSVSGIKNYLLVDEGGKNVG